MSTSERNRRIVYECQKCGNDNTVHSVEEAWKPCEVCGWNGIEYVHEEGKQFHVHRKA